MENFVQGLNWTIKTCCYMAHLGSNEVCIDRDLRFVGNAAPLQTSKAIIWILYDEENSVQGGNWLSGSSDSTPLPPFKAIFGSLIRQIGCLFGQKWSRCFGDAPPLPPAKTIFGS